MTGDQDATAEQQATAEQDVTTDQDAIAEQDAVIAQVAAQLGETEAEPLAQLRRVVAHCGAAQAVQWVAEAVAIEAAGGQLRADGRGRRTLGGVYFHLVRRNVHGNAKRYIFPQLTTLGRRGQQDLIIEPWDACGPFVTEAQQHPGKANSVKITVIGKIDKAVERQGFALVTLQHDGRLAALPKGIPVPPQPLPTSYIIYIGSKQWNKVKAALKNKEDVLIVEGVPVLDPKYQAITVFATNTTTKLLQQALRPQRPPAADAS